MRSNIRENLEQILAWTAPPATAVILAYHSVGEAEGLLTVPTPLFAEQMEWLSGRANFVPLTAIADFLSGQSQLPPHAVCITFDDVLANAVRNAVPILTAMHIPATWFMATARAGEIIQMSSGPERIATWPEIRTLCDQGFEIGAHTIDHPILTEIPIEKARQEIYGGRDALKDRLGITPVSFAYPKGNWNPAVEGLVAAAGFSCAVTVMAATVRAGMPALRLPRITMNRNTDRRQLRASLTRAIDWYERVGPRREEYRQIHSH